MKKSSLTGIAAFFAVLVLFLALPAVAWAGGNREISGQTQQVAPEPTPQLQQTPAPQPQQPPPQPVSQFWTGDGGRGRSIAILELGASGLAENQRTLPSVMQGELVANFNSFSALSVLDRMTLDAQYAELLSGYYSDDAEASWDLGHLPQTDYLMIGNITQTGSTFALQLRVTRTADKMTEASYSETFTRAELEDFTGIRRASLDLLEKLGVAPTERTRQELGSAATDNHINAQTALAQGINSQRHGTVVEALSYFIQSTNYDPSLAEAASRMNILSANISSGNIGEDTRNDIAWRRQWTERLREAETFFADYTRENQPYYLVYDTKISQGQIDYERETVDLSLRLDLLPETSWVSTINEVILTVRSGLIATGRMQDWGLDWPNRTISASSPFATKTGNYLVVVEIINSNGRSIGRRRVNMPYGYFLPQLSTGTIVPRRSGLDLSFPAVDANSITDRLDIRIVSIDGISAENTPQQKKINIMPREEYNRIPSVRASGMTTDNISRYSAPENNNVALVGWNGRGSINIPNIFSTIGSKALSGKGISSVTIPNGVVSIGEEAFSNNSLTNITIPNSVVGIGRYAFYRNSLTNITIPDSVVEIGLDAFVGNPLTSITIGADVRVSTRHPSIIYGAFVVFYQNNGRKAGVYTFDGKQTWSYRAR